uniref:Uncharacterized protein n=1 Tax=Arundo donax TaxID=35708 RepID=A0A0A8ZF10_ARUDO
MVRCTASAWASGVAQKNRGRR